MANTLVWNAERVSQLRLLWEDLSLSASAIADRMGDDITRNAVIGKVHRLGLPGRAPRGAKGGARDTQQAAEKRLKRVEAIQKREAAETARKAAIAAALERQREEEARLAALEAVKVVEPEPIAPVSPVVTPISEGVSIYELRKGTCRWPLPNGAQVTERFCGCTRAKHQIGRLKGQFLSGVPYCDKHARIAFQPSKRWRQPETCAISTSTPLNRVFGAHTN
jgi:GcrA cell cycle regulator